MEELTKELNIENMIYEVRGKQVMLDRDLAKLYQCKNGTKEINQAVKNNIEKFPERFSWKLTKKEFQDLRSNILTANISSKSRSYPRVFTEQGVAMLATIIKSRIATNISIKIMDAFVAMRKYISTNLIEQKYINNLVLEHDSEIKLLFDRLESKELVNEIFFEGQIYDAYSKIIDILLKAKDSIIIIDSYADKYVLDMISKTKISVTLILSTKSRLSKLDIDKYKKEYTNLNLVYNDSFHDRYIILDKKKLYHCGTSLNNAGNKTFSINKIEDNALINYFINLITNIIT